MPYRKNWKKRGKRPYRRRRKKGFSRRQTKSIVIRGPTVIPDQTFVKLKYVHQGTLATSGGGITAYQVFRGNGPYDPDGTGTGGQPMGYDQWSALYTRVQVLGCKITIKCAPDTANLGGATICLAPSDTASPFTGIGQVLEQPYAKYKVVANGSGGMTLSNYLSTKKKFGYKSILSEDDLSSLTTTTPSEQWYWQLALFGTSGTATAQIWYLADIQYYCRFFDRVDLGRS